MEHYELPTFRNDSAAYIEFLRTTHMSAGIYRLSAGEEDTQSPHQEEEIYFVISGKAQFEAGESRRSVGAGDILFVPPAEPHRFHSIAEDLELLVVFAPPETE